MAVEYVGKTEVLVDGGTSITIQIPTGAGNAASAGDLLICVIAKDDNVAIYETGSWGDWHELFNIISDSQTCLYVAWRIATADDVSGAVSWTWNADSEDWVGEILCYSGADTTTPIPNSGSDYLDSSATPTAPSVAFTDLTAGSMVLQVFGCDFDDEPRNVPSQLTTRFNAHQANDIGCAGGDKSDLWISPTGYNETGWTYAARSYDDDTATSTYISVSPSSWGAYLELTVSSLSCHKVRFWAKGTDITQISLDVYYSSAWHNIYEGAFTQEQWVEKEIGSTQDVTGVRAKFYNNNAGSNQTVYFYEADFFKEGITGSGNTGTAVFGIPASNEWTAATLVIEAAAAGGQFEYTGSGSLAFSGTATQTHSKDYLTSASGQLTFSGSAGQVYSKNYLYEGSGELAFSGNAVVIFGLAFIGSGSLAYSGEAVVTYTRDYLSTAVGELIYSGEAIFSYLCNFLYTGSGELAYSGVAEQSYTRNFSYEADGSFTISGEGTYTLGFAYTSSGGFTYSGEAIQVHSKYYIYTTSGSLVYSGTGTYVLGVSYTGSGSFNYSGEATSMVGFSTTGDGSLAFSGTAVTTYTVNYLCTADGSYTFGGAGTYSLGLSYTSSGSFIYSGSAEYSYQTTADFEYTGSGSYIFSGTATQIYTTDYLYVGSGDFAYSGSATQLYTKNFLYSASGQLLYSGNALYSLGFSYIGDGTFIYSGAAIQTHSRNYLYIGSGELIYSGSADCSYEVSGVVYEYLSSGQFTFGGTAFRWKEIITFLSHITKEFLLNSKIIQAITFNSYITKEIALASGITREVAFKSHITKESILKSKIDLEKD